MIMTMNEALIEAFNCLKLQKPLPGRPANSHQPSALHCPGEKNPGPKPESTATTDPTWLQITRKQRESDRFAWWEKDQILITQAEVIRTVVKEIRSMLLPHRNASLFYAEGICCPPYGTVANPSQLCCTCLA